MAEKTRTLVDMWPDILGSDEEADLAMADHLLPRLESADPEVRRRAWAELLGEIKEAIRAATPPGDFVV